MTSVATSAEPAAQLPLEDDVLAFVHATRMNMLSHVLKDGKTPEDPSVAKVAVALLKDMSSDALGRKKIKVEEKQVDASGAAASLVAEVLLAAARHKPWQATNGAERKAPVLGAEIPPPLLVEGETDAVGQSQETYETFVARTAPKSS